MALVNRSESLFSVRIPRSKVHATRDTLRLPRKLIETLTRDTRTCTSTRRREERERDREMGEIGFEDRGGTAVLDIEHTAVCASTSGRDRAPRGRGGAVDSCERSKKASVSFVDTFCTRSGRGNIVDDNILTFASPPPFVPGFIEPWILSLSLLRFHFFSDASYLTGFPIVVARYRYCDSLDASTPV